MLIVKYNQDACMSNIKSGEMFNSYECQAATVVVHVVQFSPFSWHRHVSHLRRVSMDGCQRILVCGCRVQVWSETDHNQQQYIFHMGRDRHGQRSTWAEVNMGRSRWAEIDEYPGVYCSIKVNSCIIQQLMYVVGRCESVFIVTANDLITW